eukprot:EG_transcript_35369
MLFAKARSVEEQEAVVQQALERLPVVEGLQLALASLERLLYASPSAAAWLATPPAGPTTQEAVADSEGPRPAPLPVHPLLGLRAAVAALQRLMPGTAPPEGAGGEWRRRCREAEEARAAAEAERDRLAEELESQQATVERLQATIERLQAILATVGLGNSPMPGPGFSGTVPSFPDW